MKALIALAVLSLTACVTDAPREPVIVTQIVEVPVEVKCQISYPKRPSPKLPAVTKDASSYLKAQAALTELEDQRWYSKELEASMQKCAKDIDSK